MKVSNVYNPSTGRESGEIMLFLDKNEARMLSTITEKLLEMKTKDRPGGKSVVAKRIIKGLSEMAVW